MTGQAAPRFDVAAVQRLAGGKTFSRGESYFRYGQVTIISLGPSRVLARVEGTEDYRTRLTGRGRSVGGDCSCPAFEDQPFCKHMVAVALAANAAGNEVEAPGGDPVARIRDHLMARDAQALVDMIIDLAEQDPDLFRKLDLAATAADTADDGTFEARLSRAIEDATNIDYYVDYRRVSAWAAGVNELLATIEPLASGPRAAVALRLAGLAIDRLEETFESIDDSNGEVGACLERACDIHRAAAAVARPEGLAFARELFEREMASDYGAFDGAASTYADVLGEEGLAEYRRLATDAWDQASARGEEDYRLTAIIDHYAERDGDVEARIALRARRLSSPADYLRLAQFCLAQGRDEEALRRAEDALWLFEDARPDEALVVFAVQGLIKAERKAEAQAHVDRAFARQPSLELYRWLRKLAGVAGRDQAIAVLEARLTSEAPARWPSTADLLVTILTRERMFDAAWAVADRRALSADVGKALALASEATHPERAVQLYCRRIDRLVEDGSNAGYAEAADLVARMAALRGAAGQAAHVADLKARYRRRRNFMKLLG